MHPPNIETVLNVKTVVTDKAGIVIVPVPLAFKKPFNGVVPLYNSVTIAFGVPVILITDGTFGHTVIVVGIVAVGITPRVNVTVFVYVQFIVVVKEMSSKAKSFPVSKIFLSYIQI